MKHLQKSNNLSPENLKAISIEFLETLLEEDITYPWNPMDTEVEAYFEQIEKQINLIETIPLDELEIQISELFDQMKSSFD